MAKERLDVILTKRELFPSREQARRSIMAGEVFVNGVREDKAGTLLDPDKIKSMEVKRARLPFVSRGGLKLQKAFEVFPLDVEGRVCLDIGASTGGFTDCLLQHGAGKVYAVDVGYGQLAYSLQTDPRVVSLERTNFRYITKEQVPEPIDLATADVAFISLDKILPAAKTLLKEDAQMVALVKPQFEAGREAVGKHGVVKDKKVHAKVLEKTIRMARENGFIIQGLDYSPVKGPEGNIEYLLYLSCSGEEKEEETNALIQTMVTAAHDALATKGKVEDDEERPT